MKRRRPRAPPTPQRSTCAPLPATPLGMAVERGYDTDERLLRVLFLALCRSMQLEAYRDEAQSPTMLFVRAPAATQDLLEQRFTTLSKSLDDKLMAVAVDFIRETCGVDVPIRPRD